MAEVISPGLTSGDVLALIMANAATTFVNNAQPQTVANLIANFPPAVNYQGMYARVSDLYGSVDEIMRCRFDGTNYRWVPQREAFSGTTAATSGTITITPLVTPPMLRATANLLGNMSFAPVSTNAYVGQRQRIYMQGTLGIFTATISGLIGSNLTLLGNTFKDIEFGSSGWFGV